MNVQLLYRKAWFGSAAHTRNERRDTKYYRAENSQRIHTVVDRSVLNQPVSYQRAAALDLVHVVVSQSVRRDYEFTHYDALEPSRVIACDRRSVMVVAVVHTSRTTAARPPF